MKNSCMLVAVLFHWRIGLKMKERSDRTMASRTIEVTMVRAELKGLEKRFSFTHWRGGSLVASGGAAPEALPAAAALDISDISVPPVAF